MRIVVDLSIYSENYVKQSHPLREILPNVIYIYCSVYIFVKVVTNFTPGGKGGNRNGKFNNLLDNSSTKVNVWPSERGL